MKELEGGAVPPCVLHLLPEEFVRSGGKPFAAVPDDAKLLLSNYCEYSLLMDSSVHGRSNKVFHQLCDAQGPTLALLHVGGGHLFGYYLSKSSGMGIQRAPSSFLFTVFKHDCFRPALYHMLSSEYQVLPQPSDMCTHYVTCVQVLPSQVPGALPVGWAMARNESGAAYYWCESTRHVQWSSPLVDARQAQLGPR